MQPSPIALTAGPDLPRRTGRRVATGPTCRDPHSPWIRARAPTARSRLRLDPAGAVQVSPWVIEIPRSGRSHPRACP